MKKSLLVLFTSALLALLFCCFYTATATEITASGICGENLRWTLDDSGVLIISGTGDMTDWDYFAQTPFYSNKSKIKKVVIEEGITSIGDSAFGYGILRTSLFLTA